MIYALKRADGKFLYWNQDAETARCDIWAWCSVPTITDDLAVMRDAQAFIVSKEPGVETEIVKIVMYWRHM